MDEAPVEDAGPKICSQCGAENAPDHRFCGSCGFKLLGAPPPAVAQGEPSGIVLTCLSPDGSEAGSFTLDIGETLIGRDTGVIFAGDMYLSPTHATFTAGPGMLSVRDEGSLNGVFRRLLADCGQRIDCFYDKARALAGRDL